MFAVIKTGGKQYKVAANDVLKIEKLTAEPGTIVTFDQVLMVGEGDDVTVGAPLVEGAMVAAELVETKKQRTIIILKKHRRQHYDRRNGHRQLLSSVRITEILTGGAQPTIEPRAKTAATGTDAAEAPRRTRRERAADAAGGEVAQASTDEASTEALLAEDTATADQSASADASAEEAAAPAKRSRKAAATTETTETTEGESAEAEPKKAATRKSKPQGEDQE